MSHATPSAETETDPVDHAALRLMLSYVEAECLRIGATDAARHAAMAAAMMPGSARIGAAEAGAQRPPHPASGGSGHGRRPRGRPLH